MKIESTENSTVVSDEDNNVPVFIYSNDDANNFNDKEDIENAMKYEDIFKKYGEMYGIDEKILLGIAAQESSGIHSIRNDTPAMGIMQIEKSAWIGEKVKAYNFIENKIDEVKITKEMIEDLDTNIRIGAMIFQSYLNKYEYNIPLALQAYNFGPTNINKLLTECEIECGISKNELIKNSTANEWQNYRSFLHTGDKKYVEHVMEYLGDNVEITCKKSNGENVSVIFNNNKAKNKAR